MKGATYHLYFFLILLISASVSVTTTVAASLKGTTRKAATGEDGDKAAAKIFEKLIFERSFRGVQRKKGAEDFEMDGFKKSVASLRVTYAGSSRSVEGCSGALIGAKYILLPEECVAASNGETVLDIANTQTESGVPVAAIFLPKSADIGLAVVQLKEPIDAPVAALSTAIVSSKPVAMLARDGSVTQYRHRGYAWCNRMRPAPGASDAFSCATPVNIAVCPANHGTIAFEAGDGATNSLIGFAKGGDCSTQEELGISWISLVSPFAADLKALMTNGGLDAKFTKHT